MHCTHGASVFFGRRYDKSVFDFGHVFGRADNGRSQWETKSKKSMKTLDDKQIGARKSNSWTKWYRVRFVSTDRLPFESDTPWLLLNYPGP